MTQETKNESLDRLNEGLGKLWRTTVKPLLTKTMEAQEPATDLSRLRQAFIRGWDSRGRYHGIAASIEADHALRLHMPSSYKEATTLTAQPAPTVQEPVAWEDGPHLVVRSDMRERLNYKGPWVDMGRAIPDAWVPVLYTTPPAEPVQDEHQAIIDSLPADCEEKMFMQIAHWARKSYDKHKASTRGQALMPADAFESHVIWATLRWAKENTPPAAQPAPPRATS